MPKQPAVAEYLAAIQRALSVLDVRWYVFGAQAVIFAGAVRTTADIDITVEDVPVQKLVKALKKASFVLRTGIEDLDDLIEIIEFSRWNIGRAACSWMWCALAPDESSRC